MLGRMMVFKHQRLIGTSGAHAIGRTGPRVSRGCGRIESRCNQTYGHSEVAFTQRTNTLHRLL